MPPENEPRRPAGQLGAASDQFVSRRRSDLGILVQSLASIYRESVLRIGGGG